MGLTGELGLWQLSPCRSSVSFCLPQHFSSAAPAQRLCCSLPVESRKGEPLHNCRRLPTGVAGLWYCVHLLLFCLSCCLGPAVCWVCILETVVFTSCSAVALTFGLPLIAKTHVTNNVLYFQGVH